MLPLATTASLVLEEHCVSAVAPGGGAATVLAGSGETGFRDAYDGYVLVV